jgi:hypothetical protein
MTSWEYVTFTTSKWKQKIADEITRKFEHYNAWIILQGFRIKWFHCNDITGEYANKTFWSVLG